LLALVGGYRSLFNPFGDRRAVKAPRSADPEAWNFGVGGELIDRLFVDLQQPSDFADCEYSPSWRCDITSQEPRKRKLEKIGEICE
jgi:hypothetical protein